MLTFKKNGNGYESNYKIWNDTTMKHEAKYTIEKIKKEWQLTDNTTQKTSAHSTLSEAKYTAEEIEGHKIYIDEIEKGFVDGGGWSGAVCITAIGEGFEWYKNENGEIVYK